MTGDGGVTRARVRTTLSDAQADTASEEWGEDTPGPGTLTQPSAEPGPVSDI